MNNLDKVAKSFTYAVKGWRTAFSTQLNFRIHCIAAALAVGLGLFLKIEAGEWLWLTVTIALVLSAELFNTAIEVLVDLVSPGYHEKAGKVKDLAAGAVTIMAINAVICGGIIFIPRLLAL